MWLESIMFHIDLIQIELQVHSYRTFDNEIKKYV